jgi:hypothetical protein
LYFRLVLRWKEAGFACPKKAKTPAKIEELRFTYCNIGDSQRARMRSRGRKIAGQFVEPKRLLQTFSAPAFGRN